MNRIVILLVIGLILGSCKTQEQPKGILTESEMVDILLKMYLAEEQFSKLSIPFDSATLLIPPFKQKVFERAGISDSVYLKSMQYYLAHPKQLEYIYTALVDSLSLREQASPNEYTQYATPR